jgi:hypothetical protein
VIRRSLARAEVRVGYGHCCIDRPIALGRYRAIAPQAAIAPTYVAMPLQRADHGWTVACPKGTLDGQRQPLPASTARRRRNHFEKSFREIISSYPAGDGAGGRCFAECPKGLDERTWRRDLSNVRACIPKANVAGVDVARGESRVLGAAPRASRTRDAALKASAPPAAEA